MGYKILSLDGGGSWAMIQAQVLHDLYPQLGGHEVLRQFDLVIANSGGALVLACLCSDIKPADIVEIFRNEGKRKQIFSSLRFGERNLLSHLKALFPNFPIGSKYYTERKRSGLVNVLKGHDPAFGNGTITTPFVETPLHKLPALIGKESLQIIIAGFDYFRERAVFFRSNTASHTDKFTGRRFGVTLGDAIHASSNAPVNYFSDAAELDLQWNAKEGSEQKKKLVLGWRCRRLQQPCSRRTRGSNDEQPQDSSGGFQNSFHRHRHRT